MPDVRLDESVTPAAHRAALVQALRAGRLDNRFHYAGEEAATRWRALAASHSPAHDADDGRHAYDAAARALVDAVPDGPVHLVGLACGDGTKERHLLGALAATGRTGITATAADVSVPLVTAAAEAMAAVPGVERADGVAVELMTATDLAAAIGQRAPGTRVVVLYGVLSTLGPGALRRAAALLDPGDLLLVSGNLLPPGGEDAVMAQYDNAATRDWLAVGLAEAGLADSGPVAFRWDDAGGAVRIVGEVTPAAPVVATADGVAVSLPAGTAVTVFESFRHVAGGLSPMLVAAGLSAVDEFTSPSGEEGVALGVRP